MLVKRCSIVLIVLSTIQMSLGDICTVCSCFIEGGERYVDCRKRLLSINDERYTNLFVVEDKEALHSLILSENEMSSLPQGSLRKLEMLRTLDLSHNVIDKIVIEEFTGLNNLSTLNLSNNRLEEFHSSLTNVLPNLSDLNLSHNYIKTLITSSTSMNANIKMLDISHNNLSSLNAEFFQSYPELRYLDVSYNTIDFLNSSSIIHLQHLEKLYLNNNGLLSLDLQEVSKSITMLHVGSNMLTRLPYELLQIQVLNIEHNSISEVTAEIAKLGKLKRLNISGNSLRDLPDVKLDDLNELDISYNDLSEIPQAISTTNFPQLERLILDGNPINQVKLYKKLQLKTLSISNLKNIETIDEFSFSNLQTRSNSCLYLTLSSNTQLSLIHEKAFDHINVCFLDLSYNDIKGLSGNLLLHGRHLKMQDGIDLQGNPFHCDCSSQWMLDDLVPQLYEINKGLLDNLRCRTPSIFSNSRMVHWYKWEEPVFCKNISIFRSNAAVSAIKEPSATIVTFGSSTGFLVVLTTSIAVFTLFVVIGIAFTQRMSIKKRHKNRRL